MGGLIGENDLFMATCSNLVCTGVITKKLPPFPLRRWK